MGGYSVPQNIDGRHGARRCNVLGAHTKDLSRATAVQIDLEKIVAAQLALAFATVANVIDWPQIIRSVRSLEVLTPGPIRTGTRLREVRILFGHEATQEMEIATLEPPRRLRLVSEHPDLHHELDHLVDPVYGGGCRLMLIFRSRPTTPVGQAVRPLMTPFIGVTLRDELEQDLADLAAAIAAKASLERI
jgi:hypothetical protein